MRRNATYISASFVASSKDGSATTDKRINFETFCDGVGRRDASSYLPYEVEIGRLSGPGGSIKRN